MLHCRVTMPKRYTAMRTPIWSAPKVLSKVVGIPTEGGRVGAKKGLSATARIRESWSNG
jgi:hypothetical protein